MPITSSLLDMNFGYLVRSSKPSEIMRSGMYHLYSTGCSASDLAWELIVAGEALEGSTVIVCEDRSSQRPESGVMISRVTRLQGSECLQGMQAVALGALSATIKKFCPTQKMSVVGHAFFLHNTPVATVSSSQADFGSDTQGSLPLMTTLDIQLAPLTGGPNGKRGTRLGFSPDGTIGEFLVEFEEQFRVALTKYRMTGEFTPPLTPATTTEQNFPSRPGAIEENAPIRRAFG